MPVIDYPHNLLQGLSDFWQRFFVEADQLNALYRGSALLIGQAYLDMLSNVLSVSIKDAPCFNKEYFRLLALREDQVRYIKGATLADDRWAYTITDSLVSFTSLDNRVVDPTVSLEETIDYTMDGKDIVFTQDPTDVALTGVPIAGYARRAQDIAVGGAFDDTARLVGDSWITYGVRKGDTLRMLDVGPVTARQRKRGDHPIVVVREKALYVSAATPLEYESPTQAFVIVRKGPTATIVIEGLTFVADIATLAHTRVVEGSVLLRAKTAGGSDVVEGVDYEVDYEAGRIIKLSAWQSTTGISADYTWMEEVMAWSPTGVIRSSFTTVRVVQMAMWAPDALVDRRTLANNFGSLLGVEEDSSESYRAFLRGIFQLYLLGPVLERIESAFNVVLGYPVIRDDGEILESLDLGVTDPLVLRVVTRRGLNGPLATYQFPAGTPLRSDLTVGNLKTLTFDAFEPLTTAITVTDYIQDPTWWHGREIPLELFAKEADGTVPTVARRTADARFVNNVLFATDAPRVGDPGLKVGADENGFTATNGKFYRHRLAYVLMDKYLKYHTFYVRFDPQVFASAGTPFGRSFDQLNALVLAAKPSHVFALVEPANKLLDTVSIYETGVYAPATYMGADPNGTEIYATVGDLPAGPPPYAILGLFITPSIGTPDGQPDQVLFTDSTIQVGVRGWQVGDYYFYEDQADAPDFLVPAVPVALTGAPAGPRRRRLVRVYIGTTIAGRRLVENVDYTVDYVNCTVTRLTGWDDTTLVPVAMLQLNIGNSVDAPADTLLGDMLLLAGGIDAALVTAEFSAAARDWMDNLVDPLNARDLGLVERALIVQTGPP